MDRLRAAALLTIGLVAACSSPSVTIAPPTPSKPAATPTFATPTMDIEQPGLTPSTGQTDTQWGPIWNEVPDGFPVLDGAEATEPVGPEGGPVSAAYTIPVGTAKTPLAVAQRYVDAFAVAGYGGGRDGPLEDGSYSAWASNGYGCDILVTAVPRGEAEILATVLYGAGCPFSWPEG